MSSRTISVSSRALGKRDKVTVRIYDTVDEMRAAMHRFHNRPEPDDTDTVGVTQSVNLASNHRTHSVIVRLARGHLSTQVVSHEMHHAVTAIYGAHVGDRISTLHHLNHYNEPFAHLYSDLFTRLVDRMYDLGYYPTNKEAS